MSPQRWIGMNTQATSERRQDMRIQHRSRGVAWAGIALALLVGVLGSGPASAQPDFTNVSDILNGRRHLLRTDDLIIAYQIGTGTPLTSLGSRLLTDNSTITSSTPSSLSSSDSMSNPIVIGARLFNTANDVAVTAVLDNASGLQWVLDGAGDTIAQGVQFPTIPGPRLFAAAADFTGDGFDDLIFFSSDETSPPPFLHSPSAMFATAVDPATPSQGLRMGGWSNYAGEGTPLAIATATVAGAPQVFSLAHTEDDPTGNCTFLNDLVIASWRVNTDDLFPFPVGTLFPLTIPEGDAACGQFAAMAVGRFGNALQDQLVVAYAVQGGTVKVIPIDVDAQGNLVQKTLFDTKQGVGTGQAWIRSGRFDWSGAFDQAALVIASGQENSLRILTFDQNLTVQSGPVSTDIGQSPLCVGDVAVGNFDQTQANPTPPPATSRNPNPQLAAFLQIQCGGGNFAVQIWDVTPVDTAPGEFQVGPGNTVFTFSSPSAGAVPPQSMAMAAADLQGRSLRLGAPTKVTITTHKQTDIVLGIPPMHIDWINPVLPGTTPGLPPDCQSAPNPCVLNLTVQPGIPGSVGFSTQYAFSESSKSSASRKSTTSYSFSTRETGEAKVSYGVPDVAQISVDAKFSAQQTHDGTVAATFNTYSGKTEGLTSTTGFADHLFYTERRVNIYYYPVIGQAVCPNDQPACAEGDKRPLHVQFSGPDLVDHTDIDATTQEWYQPLHEPGNIFSYPWTVAQLEQSLPGLVALAGDLDQPNWQGTDTSSSAYSSHWNQGSGSDQSSGSVSTNQMDASLTVAGEAGIEGFGISGSAGFEANSSESIGTLNTSTQTLDSSTGIQVNKPGFSGLVADNYVYSFAGYVLGQTSPTGTLQTIPLTDEDDNPIDIQSTGPLTVTFLADPFQVNLPWWRQAYTRPDVGLNHPERWDWSTSTQTAAFNPADQSSSTPQDQAFYHIKGLFITPAGANGTGPQLTQATAGDTLQLQARVYNFSLADMPPGTQVHVQFYAQPYENAQLVGNSFPIGTAVIDQPICGFNSSSPACSGQPNWALASTSFNTCAFAQTKAGDVFLIFWVLVWMQDGQGNVVAELPDHGLTSGFTPSTTFAQITDVPIEAYSNNMGFYGYTGSGFYLVASGACEPGATAAQPGHLIATAAQPGHLIVEHLRVEGTGPIPLDRKTKVTVSLRTGDTALGQLPVVFYDGEPDQGGRPFDIMHLSRLRPNATTQSRVFFRPQTCGTHTLVAVAGPATAAPAIGRTTVEVTLETVAATDGLIKSTTSLALSESEAQRLVTPLRVARWGFAHQRPRIATLGLTWFIGEVELQRGTTLTETQADALIGQAKVILSCV